MATRLPAFLAVLVAVSSAVAQDPKPTRPALEPLQTAPARRQIPEAVTGIRDVIDKWKREKPGVTEAITVNGEALPASELDREMLYWVGRVQIQQKILELIVQGELDQQAKTAARRKEPVIPEKEIDEHIRETREEWEKANPGKGSFEEHLRRSNTSLPEYRSWIRTQMLVDELFPANMPRRWPKAAAEAIKTSGAEVRFASDGIPKDALVLVNGRPFTIEDAKRLILPKTRPEDLERAVAEIALRTALKQELKRRGAWLSDEDFRKEYETWCEPFDRTPFTAEVIATAFKGYPTMEAFKQRWRLLKSHENMIAKEINDETLAAHILQVKNFFGGARVEVQYIRLPAVDDATGTWRENAWAAAKVDAEAAMGALAKGMSFDEARKSFGRFRPDDADGGRLGLKSFNELRQKLGESEYLDLLSSHSVARILLDETKEGQVVGPLLTHDGFVIAKLVSRQLPEDVIDIRDARTRDLLRQDYITARFLAWAREVAAKMRLE